MDFMIHITSFFIKLNFVMLYVENIYIVPIIAKNAVSSLFAYIVIVNTHFDNFKHARGKLQTPTHIPDFNRVEMFHSSHVQLECG